MDDIKNPKTFIERIIKILFPVLPIFIASCNNNPHYVYECGLVIIDPAKLLMYFNKPAREKYCTSSQDTDENDIENTIESRLCTGVNCVLDKSLYICPIISEEENYFIAGYKISATVFYNKDTNEGYIDERGGVSIFGLEANKHSTDLLKCKKIFVW